MHAISGSRAANLGDRSHIMLSMLVIEDWVFHAALCHNGMLVIISIRAWQLYLQYSYLSVVIFLLRTQRI